MTWRLVLLSPYPKNSGFRPCQGHCFVFLGLILTMPRSTHLMDTDIFNAGSYQAMDWYPVQGGI